MTSWAGARSVSTADRTADRTGDRPSGHGDDRTGRRVVVVDDTADLRELLRMALTRAGYDVVGEAGDGRQGIEAVRATRPDLVLLDLSMPGMDGLEALPPIRRSVPGATVVVLSSFGATQMAARALAVGADGYVQKGASLDSILDYVDDLASGTAAPRAADPPPAGPPPGTATSISWWQALSAAPVGILEVADEPLFRVVFANPVAQRLLGGSAGEGTPLGFVSAALATLVAYHRLDADATFEVELDGAAVRATMRRTGWSLLVFLDSASDDVGLLRRAIATTAQEVRGPVSVICGIAEAHEWADDDLEPSVRSGLMSSVARQARVLDSMTADLVTAAQVQAGTLRAELRPVRPAALVSSVVQEIHRGGPAPAVQVRVEDERAVRADPLRLRQMVANLLSNALRYGGAPFLVHVRGDGDRVCLDVVDRGPGVAEELRAHLFGEFTRATGALATGTGLGLYVVRALAEAQGGSVSYAPGPYGGSVFTISLAAVSTPPLDEPPAEGAGGPAE